MSVDSDFETIYREAFRSATGSEFAGAHQVVHDAFVERAAAETLEAWTAKDTMPGVSLLSSSDVAENCHIVHPRQTEFDETDLATIARVRFFGRVVIDAAKDQLTQKERFTNLRNQDPTDLYNYFQAYYWHETHRRAGNGNDNQDPDEASPLRLAEWPYGEHLNCLGMSIALAAASELFGLTYVYGNEVRNADSVLAEQHTVLMAYVRRLMPDFDDIATRSILLQAMHDIREPDEEYDDILYDTPDPLLPSGRIRDFHHFVVTENPDNRDQNMWMQVDPFDLGFDHLSSEVREIDAALQPLFERGNENSVVLSDAYKLVTGFYRNFNEQLRWVYDAGKELVREGLEPSLYKTDKLVEHLRTGISEIAHAALAELYGGESLPVDSEQYQNDEDLVNRLYLYSLFAFAAKVPAASEQIRQVQRKNTPGGVLGLEATLEKIIAREAEYDPRLRADFARVMVKIPLLSLVHLYEFNLRESLRIRESGAAGPVMELADPEFMIGAMYLNHYATWRKDGRINVARHLSRICSSQLLWQAARQDEKEFDDRIAAMGQVIRGLKPRQLHPLVNIASGIPIPTNR